MRLDIRYQTRFEYDRPVRESHNEVRACPVDDAHQRVLDFRVRVEPGCSVQSFRDYWGTRVEAFAVVAGHDRLDVLAEMSVETHPRDELPPPAVHIADVAALDDLHEYRRPSHHVRWTPAMGEQARSIVAPTGSAFAAAEALCAWVHEAVDYAPGSTTVDTTAEEVFDDRRGVCQDTAHLSVALCRAVGLPARYVSGYLFARRSDDGDESADEISVQTHAWVEAAVAPGEWRPFDPTNGRSVGERHVKIGHGRDYWDVTPFHGSFSGRADPTLVTSVDIRRRSSGEGRVPILSAADRGLLRRPVPQSPRRAQAEQQQQ